MITLSRTNSNNTKKMHCPICGARLCDVERTESVRYKPNNQIGIVIKCYKCKNKFSININ